MQYPSPGKGKCIDRDLTVQPKDRLSSSDATLATGSNQQIPKKKRGQEANASNLRENQTHKK
eukprot:3486064-Ditylum_brightwellii.AAC.1